MNTVCGNKDTRIELFGYTLKNPVIPASGTFGFGYEFADWYDINILGSISLKGTTLEARYGNPQPRIADCPAGLINAIGLENPGVENVVSRELVKLVLYLRRFVVERLDFHLAHIIGFGDVFHLNKCHGCFRGMPDVLSARVRRAAPFADEKPHTYYILAHRRGDFYAFCVAAQNPAKQTKIHTHFW